MKESIFTILTILFFYSSTLANGGPVDVNLFRKTGNIRLLNKASISLEKEALCLKIENDFTIVNVKYVLKNNGDDETVIYGFPIDAVEGSKYSDFKGNPFKFGNNENEFVNIKYFNAYIDQKATRITSWITDSLYVIQLNQQIRRVYRKWFITKIHFNKGEKKELNIEYKIENNKYDRLPGFAYIHRFSERSFTYHLFPSSKWGNGIIKDFSIDIDLSNLVETGATFNIDGMDYLEKKSGGYKYRTTNYDLNKSNRINITYNNKCQKLAAFILDNNVKDKIIKHIRTSTDVGNANNLIDNNPNTVWTGKTGDWFEIEFKLVSCKPTIYKDHVSIYGLLGLNGNFTNKKEFLESGKIKTCLLVINDTIKYNTEPWKWPEGKKTIILKEQLYTETNDKSGFATIIADNHFLEGRFNQRKKKIVPTKKIRVRITGIYQGTKDNDTFSISELYFVGQ